MILRTWSGSSVEGRYWLAFLGWLRSLPYIRGRCPECRWFLYQMPGRADRKCPRCLWPYPLGPDA